MTRIGLLSDTHAYWDEKYLEYFEPCDEIWHAGDIGSLELADAIAYSYSKGEKVIIPAFAVERTQEMTRLASSKSFSARSFTNSDMPDRKC